MRRDGVHLPTTKDQKRITSHESLVDAAKRISALGKGGPADLASNVDAYLYGGKQ